MSIRYRSMDVLRSLAILLVVLAHTVLSFGAPESLAPLQLGGTGVYLFFVLSGWLLGELLFKEQNASGRIDVMRFWARRWMRTIPAYLAVLLVLLVYRYVRHDRVEFPWEYFLFLQNYFYPLEFYYVSWSLCVEEQFYLVIAPFLALSARYFPNYLGWTLVVLVAMPEVLRTLGLYSHDMETHVRFDGCLMGVLLAYIHTHSPYLWRRLTKYALPLSSVSFACYIGFYLLRYQDSHQTFEPNELFLSIIFASWVVLANSDNKWRETLSFPGANYIATRSYAVYLLHPEALAGLKYFRDELSFAAYLILALAITFVLAEVLYRYVELPFMNLRARWRITQ